MLFVQKWQYFQVVFSTSLKFRIKITNLKGKTGKKYFKMYNFLQNFGFDKEVDVALCKCNALGKFICQAWGIYSILPAQLAALHSEKAPFVSSWGRAE